MTGERPGFAGGERLAHHDLCFGCGLANVFGLNLEARREGPDRVAGRFFVKQDHQGPAGAAHAGVLLAALHEVAALLSGHEHSALQAELLAGAPVGSYVEVTAIGDEDGASATATTGDGTTLARARFTAPRPGA